MLQTVGSGISSLPLSSFLLLMLSIHVPIGLVEGFATAAILLFIQRAQPDLVARAAPASPASASMKPLLAAPAIATIVTGGAMSWFASKAPDGLEWSIEQAAGSAGTAAPATAFHGFLAQLQERLSFLPDDQIPGTAAAAVDPLVLAVLGEVPAAPVLRKLALAAPFAVKVGLFNPWLDRAPVVVFGDTTLAAGWWSFASILLRFTLTVGASLVLVAGTGMFALGAALARLGVPRWIGTTLLGLGA